MNDLIETEDESTVLRKLPLWKEWIKEHLEELDYGARFTTTELEEYFDERHGTIGFAMSMVPIYRFLRRRGMCMSEAGQMGSSFIIRSVETNTTTGKLMWKRAESQMKESLVLLESTPRELLNAEQRAELEKTLEKNATKFALMLGRPDAKLLKNEK